MEPVALFPAAPPLGAPRTGRRTPGRGKPPGAAGSRWTLPGAVSSQLMTECPAFQTPGELSFRGVQADVIQNSLGQLFAGLAARWNHLVIKKGKEKKSYRLGFNPKDSGVLLKGAPREGPHLIRTSGHQLENPRERDLWGPARVQGL